MGNSKKQFFLVMEAIFTSSAKFLSVCVEEDVHYVGLFSPYNKFLYFVIKNKQSAYMYFARVSIGSLFFFT